MMRVQTLENRNIWEGVYTAPSCDRTCCWPQHTCLSPSLLRYKRFLDV